MSQKINIILFGIGDIGSTFINKIIKSRKILLEDKNLDVRLPVITNSTVAFFEKEGTGYAWEANFKEFAIPFKFEDVLEYVHSAGLKNLIAIDATEDEETIEHYTSLISSGFNVFSANAVLKSLPPGLIKGITVEADSEGVVYKYVNPQQGKDKTAQQLYEAVVDTAEKNVRLAS